MKGIGSFAFSSWVPLVQHHDVREFRANHRKKRKEEKEKKKRKEKEKEKPAIISSEFELAERGLVRSINLLTIEELGASSEVRSITGTARQQEQEKERKEKNKKKVLRIDPSQKNNQK